jgi:hypothetical protein
LRKGEVIDVPETPFYLSCILRKGEVIDVPETPCLYFESLFAYS